MSDIKVVIEGDETPRADRVAEAERQTAHWNAQAARLRAEAHHNRLEAARIQVDAGLRQTAAEADAARAAYRNTLDAGDFEGTAQAVEKLTEVEVRRRELQHHEQALARTPAVPADPVEAYCANRTEPTQRWLREHRDWVTDPRKNAKLTAVLTSTARSPQSMRKSCPASTTHCISFATNGGSECELASVRTNARGHPVRSDHQGIDEGGRCRSTPAFSSVEGGGTKVGWSSRPSSMCLPTSRTA